MAVTEDPVGLVFYPQGDTTIGSLVISLDTQNWRSAQSNENVRVPTSKVQEPVFSTNQDTQLSPPCNFYIGDNFSVKLPIHEWFEFNRLITQTGDSGIVNCTFSPFKVVDTMEFSKSGQKLKDEPNAGGNSVLSEVMSFEMLRVMFGATLVKTEMEVDYFPEGGSITDYMCEMLGENLGVSVTRAMKYKGDFEDEDAEKLLNKKLKGVIQSSRNTLDKWNKQILHVWTPSFHVADVITRVYNQLPPHVKSNTVVLVTTTMYSDFIFKNK